MDRITELQLSSVDEASDLVIELSDRVKFAGLTLSEWSNELQVLIPEDIDDLVEISKLFIKIAKNYQIAGRAYAQCCATYDIVLSSNATEKNLAIVKIIQNYEARNAKRPAQSLIEAQADEVPKETDSYLLILKILKAYFKNQLDSLLETRKALEASTMASSTHLKYLTR